MPIRRRGSVSLLRKAKALDGASVALLLWRRPWGMAKKRLDVLVTERGLAESRQKAQGADYGREVFSGDRKLIKPV